MIVSSRTPEGRPSRCPLCGAKTNLEFSDPAGDAPCPKCGHLLWFSQELLFRFQNELANELGINPALITPDATFTELGADSLKTVELVMELEEKLAVSIPDNVAEHIQTVGDLIRYLEKERRGDTRK